MSFGSSEFFLLQYLFSSSSYYPLERNFTCTDQSTKFVFSNLFVAISVFVSYFGLLIPPNCSFNRLSETLRTA